MPYEVKMPQLGMNQDSAIIVSWLKAAGDKVSAGEPIFEVETDKATMEVEALADGFLAGIRAAEGDDVPVGDVIALVVETEAEIAEHAGAAPTPSEAAPDPVPEPAKVAEDSPPAQVEENEPAEAPPQKAPPQKAPPPPAPAGTVLASPLAKRMATERGIDLAALRAQGIAEPIHASDLSNAFTGGQSQLSAKADGSALDALLANAEQADRTALLATFAAGGWRQVFEADAAAIAIRGLDGKVTVQADPRSGETGAASLTLVDLCGTRLRSFAPAGRGITLSAARDGAAYALTLSFDERTLQFPAAAALLDAIAARVEDPIRQLL